MPKVTVVPEDHLIIVDGETLFFNYDAPDGMHALQWDGTAGHIEWKGTAENQLLSADDYDSVVAPYVTLWQAEKDRRAAEAAAAEAEYNSLDNVKARKLVAIDAETSAAILAGFECEATPPDTDVPELLHFSYDEFDQQNFADAALSMQFTSADASIPTTTPWNAYRNHTADSKGDLVILELTAETFLPIYAAALNYKATKMAEGGQRKAAVAAAQTVEEVKAI